MDDQTIQLAIESGLATITLNRPDKRNAISYELIDEPAARARRSEKTRRRGF